MWTVPKIGEKVRISDKFWEKFKNYRNRTKIRPMPPWYDNCERDGGWTVERISDDDNERDIYIKFSGHESAFQLSRGTGSLFSFRDGPCMFVPYNQEGTRCPICGSSGTDLVFSFYCSNNECQNYR